ncbi:MAG TPA: hypothetical protein VND92_07165 [Vicinamibacterales bacterium]|nr:hypothetical protein [Vicinamibacterales bacterium]
MIAGSKSGGRTSLFPLALAALLLALSVAALAMGQFSNDDDVIGYASATPTDPVAQLQKQIDSGQVQLAFDPNHGYLPAVLKALHVPVSSQGLVFSRTSLQVDHISPWSPRAIYFNDDVYVGWVQNGPIMEVAAVDPRLGGVFYTLDQQPTAHPKFQRQFSTCLQCHDSSSSTGGVPGFIMRSVFADKMGYPISSPVAATTQQTPIAERWGGWYVTGTTGPQPHLGNLMAPVSAHDVGDPDAYLATMKIGPNLNVTSLSSRFDTEPYLSPHSDAVALMVLADQTYIHNLITLAGYEARKAVYDDELASATGGAGATSEGAMVRIRGAAERLVRGLLYAREAPLASPIKGDSTFAADFVKVGPHDHLGRSLRDLDLKTRLFTYPLSYLIYSDSFNALPDVVKDYVYRRLDQVLSGQDPKGDFTDLNPADRTAIREILQDTKPEFAATLTAAAK